ncbi:MAG: hypothetical protein KC613_17095 [Myxococcales bacterium]|nr:hypothetical protein [Myxococcales bacterium]
MRRLLPLALPLALFACADATPTLVDAPEPTPGLDGALPDRWAPPADLAFPDQAFDLGPEMGADASPHGDPCQPAEVPPELPNERLCDPRRPDCPEGYECRQLRNAGADTAYVCAPPACIDRDGDGYGAGADCAGMDCNDCDVSTHAGAAERCDGFDNDCDGQIDEGLDPRQAPADLPCGGPGVCADDTVECVEGQWTCRRSPHWQPDELRCDNLDNDCNGVVDDIEGRGEACSAGEGPCRREGVLVCNGVSGELDCTANPDQPQPERCNGIDDDCNGVVDDVAEAGTRCELGEGACAAIGEWLCNPAQQRLFCSARPAMPADEICDGRDNDCDGEVDEGQGLCPDPVEQCNGLDDDGDGRVDFPDDPSCPAAFGTSENGPPGRRCSDGADNDLDGLIDLADPGCESTRDDDEADPDGAPACANDADDDADGATDWPDDAGCAGAGDLCEQEGFAFCDGACIDVQDDENNCGRCGRVCEAGVECLEGACGGLFFYEGIGQDVPEIDLDGWEMCYQGTYNESTELAPILDACSGSMVAIGCRMAGAEDFTLLAMGETAEVFFDVGNANDAVNNHNGVDFYYSPSRSMGFAPEGAGVNRNSCDTANVMPELRMCWHTSGGRLNSGWRCGATTGIGNAQWERVIFTAE